MKAPAQILSELDAYYCTEAYHRILLHPKDVVFTDGAKAMADLCEAYWFLDIVAFAQAHPKVSGEGFQLWTLQVSADRTAHIEARTDTKGKLLYQQDIEYTDFPLPEFKLYVEGNVILLPTEH